MQTTIATRSEFIGAVRALIDEAAIGAVRELFLCDPDFADWPLNEPVLIEALTQWAAPHRRLVLIAQSYDEVMRRHPRFVQWRKVWSHLVDARLPDELPAADHPTLLLAGDLASLRLLDRTHWRCRVSREVTDLRACRDELDAISQRSSPAFASTTLGL